MPAERDHLKAVTALAEDLGQAGLQAVLVGGMALIILGSRRITMDFDLLVDAATLKPEVLIAIMYRHNFKLVTRFNPDGTALRSADNANVAAAKLKMELPKSLHFWDHRTGLLVDLLLDFPVPARDVILRATRVSNSGGTLRIAAREDLIHLKDIAHRERKKASDAQDLEFLRGLKRT